MAEYQKMQKRKNIQSKRLNNWQIFWSKLLSPLLQQYI